MPLELDKWTEGIVNPQGKLLLMLLVVRVCVLLYSTYLCNTVGLGGGAYFFFWGGVGKILKLSLPYS